MTLASAIEEAVELAAREGITFRVVLGAGGEYEVSRVGEDLDPPGYWTDLAVYHPDGTHRTFTA